MSKALPGDRALLQDESVSPGQRVAALDRLLADGDDVTEFVKPWLDEEDQSLKQFALKALLRMGHREYVRLALDWLKAGAFPPPSGEGYIDEDAFAKMAAACGLGLYMYGTWVERQRICGALAKVLVESSDPGVQRDCYEALFAADGVLFPGVPTEFSRERDVDWSIVRRYLPEEE